MEMTRSRMDTRVENPETERGDWARNIVRAIAQRRSERRARQLVQGIRSRTRSINRGALIGYAVQENPGRAVIISFTLGTVLGAIGYALKNISDDFQEILLTEGEDIEETEHRRRAA